MTDGLTYLNSCAESELSTALNRACAAARWVQAMLAARPYASLVELWAAVERHAETLTTSDWLEAFAQHPKIGDLGSLRARFADTAYLASSEQSGVALASDTTLQALAAGNAAYEGKFGYIFIVCASGKSASEMLGLLQERLENPAELELKVAAAEQVKITRLRLQAWLDAHKDGSS